MSKLVSIYMPTHNRGDLLSRTIDSIINQTYRNLELIIVNDGSTDNTEDIIKKYLKQDNRIKYIKLDRSQGANVARNIAIKSAKGYYITGMDDDDEMVSNRIEILINAYDEQKYSFIYSAYYVQYKNKIKYKLLTLKKEISLSDMLYTNVVGNHILTTKKYFEEAKLYDEKILAAQDLDMWIRLLKLNKAKVVRKPLYIVNIDSNNRISDSKNKLKGYLQVFTKHKNIMTKDQRKFNILNFYLYKNGFMHISMLVKYLPRKFPYNLYLIYKYLKLNILASSK